MQATSQKRNIRVLRQGKSYRACVRINANGDTFTEYSRLRRDKHLAYIEGMQILAEYTVSI
jgi:hypothetical protein